MILSVTARSEPESAEAPEIARLVDSARRGAEAAFESLYRRFARSVHAVLLARLPVEDAQEAVQEVFLAAHRRLVDLREPDAFGPWILAIARNAAASRIRDRRRRPTSESLRDLAVPGESREDGALRERVIALIRGLPEAYRETLVMRLVDGMSGPEIAEATGLTPASVRVNLHRGLEMIRPALKNEGWA